MAVKTNKEIADEAYKKYLYNLYKRKQQDAELDIRGVDFSTRQKISNEKGGVSSNSSDKPSRTEVVVAQTETIEQLKKEGVSNDKIVNYMTGNRDLVASDFSSTRDFVNQSRNAGYNPAQIVNAATRGGKYDGPSEKFLHTREDNPFTGTYGASLLYPKYKVASTSDGGGLWTESRQVPKPVEYSYTSYADLAQRQTYDQRADGMSSAFNQAGTRFDRYREPIKIAGEFGIGAGKEAIKIGSEIGKGAGSGVKAFGYRVGSVPFTSFFPEGNPNRAYGEQMLAKSNAEFQSKEFETFRVAVGSVASRPFLAAFSGYQFTEIIKQPKPLGAGEYGGRSVQFAATLIGVKEGVAPITSKFAGFTVKTLGERGNLKGYEKWDTLVKPELDKSGRGIPTVKSFADAVKTYKESTFNYKYTLQKTETVGEFQFGSSSLTNEIPLSGSIVSKTKTGTRTRTKTEVVTANQGGFANEFKIESQPGTKQSAGLEPKGVYTAAGRNIFTGFLGLADDVGGYLSPSIPRSFGVGFGSSGKPTATRFNLDVVKRVPKSVRNAQGYDVLTDFFRRDAFNPTRTAYYTPRMEIGLGTTPRTNVVAKESGFFWGRYYEKGKSYPKPGTIEPETIIGDSRPGRIISPRTFVGKIIGSDKYTVAPNYQIVNLARGQIGYLKAEGVASFGYPRKSTKKTSSRKTETTEKINTVGKLLKSQSESYSARSGRRSLPYSSALSSSINNISSALSSSSRNSSLSSFGSQSSYSSRSNKSSYSAISSLSYPSSSYPSKSNKYSYPSSLPSRKSGNSSGYAFEKSGLLPLTYDFDMYNESKPNRRTGKGKPSRKKVAYTPTAYALSMGFKGKVNNLYDVTSGLGVRPI